MYLFAKVSAQTALVTNCGQTVKSCFQAVAKLSAVTNMQGLTGSRYPTRPEVKNPYPSGPGFGEGPSELVCLMDSHKLIVC